MAHPDQYQRRLAAGFCPVCGVHPRGTRTVRCDACAVRARAAQAARQQAALDAGVCLRCLAVEAVPGRGGRCATCADKNAVNAARWKAAQVARGAGSDRAVSPPAAQGPSDG